MIVERIGVERRVAASLEAGRIPVILGGCGTGRTSLLLRLERTPSLGVSQYLNFAAAATTPERCLSAVLNSARPPLRRDVQAVADTPRAAFEALLAWLDRPTGDDTRVTFLIDEWLDVRTFENFPGLRHVQRDLIARLSSTRTGFVLASRFTSRVHRLLRDAPARFEVVHVPPLDAAEVASVARRFDAARGAWAADAAAAVAALAGGRAACVSLMLDAIAGMGPAIDPVAALAALFAPDGRLTARCRESYELRLHRARGYGALKAILGILADDEPRNLTEIAHALGRTPGSTKDYLSWLEDVDLITAQGKKYTFDDPLIRLYVRLYGRPVPPTDDDIVREVGTYARQRLPQTPPAPRDVPKAVPVRSEAVEAVVESARGSGIIEID
ncbi:MAG TPA: hypothetical protein VFO19_03670 [Vicinamibacterales bacterium]|nr:hypothetical protein [Vicinamibacterales bacterium]